MGVNVFISYRRDDASDFAGRLAQKLEAMDDIGDVFIDVDGIEPGTDFVARIRSALSRSQMCLVVIGPRWLGPVDGGTSRIHNPRDFVRLEVHEALRGTARVVPVLANAARMPAAQDLPADLRALTDRQAFMIRHESFERDVDFLVDSMLERSHEARTPFSRRHPYLSKVLAAAVGFCLGLVALVVTLAFVNALTGKSLEQLVGGRGPMYGVVLLVLVLAAVIPLIAASTRRRV